MERIILEEKHLKTQMNEFITDQEELSQQNRNQALLIQAQIDLLASQTNEAIQLHTQSQKELGTSQRIKLNFGRPDNTLDSFLF